MVVAATGVCLFGLANALATRNSVAAVVSESARTAPVVRHAFATAVFAAASGYAMTVMTADNHSRSETLIEVTAISLLGIALLTSSFIVRKREKHLLHKTRS